MNARRYFNRFAGVLVSVLLLVSVAEAKTLRLFVIGNSFSNNATRFLPDLAKEGGHELIMAKAQLGGCSLERHWNGVAASLANPEDPKAKIYNKKSLHELISGDKWDVITLQQYSLHSPNVTTYHPFAEQLHAHLKKIQPQAEIVLHQTWAYRVDAQKFGQVASGKNAATQREMWENSRASYHQVAKELGVRILPVGDAFWRVDSDPLWGYKPTSVDEKAYAYPALPEQKHSLHVGFRWTPEKKFGRDYNHANAAGEYLGALVWYAVLFDESPEKLSFVPSGVDKEFAAHLRKVAAAVAREARKVASSG